MPHPGHNWIEELALSNPQGVMKVLASNGYTGYLAPRDENELVQAALDFVQSEGDDAVIELVKAHPLYDVIAGISREKKQIPLSFRNAEGEESQVIAEFSNINYKKVIEVILVIIGIVFVADKLFGYIFKE